MFKTKTRLLSACFSTSEKWSTKFFSAFIYFRFLKIINIFVLRDRALCSGVLWTSLRWIQLSKWKLLEECFFPSTCQLKNKNRFFEWCKLTMASCFISVRTLHSMLFVLLTNSHKMLQFNSKNSKSFYLSNGSKAIVCTALVRASANPCILREMVP